jgi:hypothetical protein
MFVDCTSDLGTDVNLSNVISDSSLLVSVPSSVFIIIKACIIIQWNYFSLQKFIQIDTCVKLVFAVNRLHYKFLTSIRHAREISEGTALWSAVNDATVGVKWWQCEVTKVSVTTSDAVICMVDQVFIRKVWPWRVGVCRGESPAQLAASGRFLTTNFGTTVDIKQ